jgi:sulfur relay (sulfurtransferase) DsrF/TusC family protein
MDNLLVILRKPPYGTASAAEAVRHAGGASGFNYKATLYLIDSGVYSGKKNQAAGDTGFSEVGESLELLADEMEIYANKDSLNEYGLETDDLMECINVDDGTVLKEAIENSKSVMIF